MLNIFRKRHAPSDKERGVHSIKISHERYEKLKEIAAREGKLVGWVLGKAVDRYLKEKGAAGGDHRTESREALSQ